MGHQINKIIVLLLLSLWSLQSYGEVIKSRAFESKYSDAQDFDQIESMKQEIENLNARLEKLEREMLLVKSGAGNVSNKNDALIEDAMVRPKEELQTPSEEKSQKAIDASDSLNQLDTKSTGTEKQKYDMALLALKSNDLSVAAQRFEDFFQQYPKGQLLSNAHFWYGEIFSKQKIHDKAALHYLKSYKLAPKGAKASDSLYKLAVSLNEIKKTKDACGILNKLDNEFPGRSSAAKKKSEDLRSVIKCK